MEEKMIKLWTCTIGGYLMLRGLEFAASIEIIDEDDILVEVPESDIVWDEENCFYLVTTTKGRVVNDEP